MDTKDRDHLPASPDVDAEILDTEAARRRMMVRLGVIGAATAPVLLGALKADRAVAQTGGIPGGEIPGTGTTGGGGGVVIPS